MRWALTYRAVPRIEDESADGRLVDLAALLSQRGWTPLDVGARGDGDHVSVLCEGEGGAPNVEVTGLELIAYQVLESAGLPEPPLVEPDPAAVDPRPGAWREVRAPGDREVDVVYGRGVVQRLRSVHVEESAREVIVTLWLGTVPNLPEHTAVTLQLIVEAVRVRLESPLAGRPIRDGASGTQHRAPRRPG